MPSSPRVWRTGPALPLLRAWGNDLDPARATWAFAHGMVILEIHGRFPHDADLETAWQRGLKAPHPRMARPGTSPA
ncbi:TetR-like C-terminal domain-containing protein [Streptomyces sp. YKOK-J1]